MISVIIPNYNHAIYLEERIESVLNQTFQDFELIILDDCSTDNSKEIIERYRSHPKVSHIIYNSHNSGSSFIQWERGLQLARGEWIWIAESDDSCEVSLLQELTEGLKKFPSSVIAYCQSIMYRDNQILWQSLERQLHKCESGKEFVDTRMLVGNAIYNASMCIFSKSAWLKIPREFMKYKFCGDWLFWIEIARQGDVFISGKTLNYFRKHDKDVSTNAFNSGLSYEEHFLLIKYLEKCGYITRKQSIPTLKTKFKNLLTDKRINASASKQVSKKFRQSLGVSHLRAVYLWYFQHLVKKWIKAFLS